MKADSSYDPGSVLLGRYRIVSLIGEGGMGEVYKADDLTLGQPVALKFLPEELVEREDLKRRFHEEVRIARRVTHRNVARVHDIAEVDGRPVLSMEYVDGEDLSKLLKQIGRLPREKALDIARQICAGLTAAHEANVLHRDLKPANVLLDRAGKVHLTDFGLASLTEEDAGGGIVGTPAYMAPEQINGGRVDVRSEVYSLGLLLYELFTGKRAFDGRSFEELRLQHAQSTPMTPTSVLTDMDPAVERVILKCLEKDPEERPSTVKAVAWALPGGDPLAAALAAGETPPPELVAAAGEGAGVAPGAAVALLVLVLAGLATIFFLGRTTDFVAYADPSLPPQVLQERAREALALCGERPPPVDRTFGFWKDFAAFDWTARNDQRPDRWERLVDRAQPVLFWYRESPRPIAPYNYATLGPSYVDPPLIVPGMARVSLDADGGLRSLALVPPSYDEAEGPWGEPSWDGFFEAAGLELADFAPVTPRWTPGVASDRRFAWERPEAEGADVLRVEAASFRGFPCSFVLYPPWVEPPSPSGPTGATVQRTERIQVIGAVLILSVLLGAAFIARRNHLLGRGDMKGALRLGVFVVLTRLAAWVCSAHHLPAVQEFNAFIYALAFGVLVGAFVWTFYLALEPYFRRLWPRRLVSWVRVLGGRVRDPLVGRDVLVGLLLGIVGVLLTQGYQLLAPWFGYAAPRPDLLTGGLSVLTALEGTRAGVAILLIGAMSSLTNGLIFAVALLVLRIVLRLQALASVAFVLLMTYLFAPAGGHPLADLSLGAVAAALYLVVLLRFGLLAAVVGTFATVVLASTPLVLDTSAWYAGNVLLAAATLLGLTAFGFFTALGGQTLFRDRVFEGAPSA